VDGILAGVELRESLKLRDWQRAQEMIRTWEADEGRTAKQEAKTLDAAWKEFLADIEARKLADSTIRKYKLLNRQMEEFAKERGFRFLIELDLPAVSQFRAGQRDCIAHWMVALRQVRFHILDHGHRANHSSPVAGVSAHVRIIAGRGRSGGAST